MYESEALHVYSGLTQDCTFESPPVPLGWSGKWITSGIARKETLAVKTTAPWRSNERRTIKVMEEPLATNLENEPVPEEVPTGAGEQAAESQASTSDDILTSFRLEDLPDPPAGQRPPHTIRVLATAALRSSPTGKLSLEDMVEAISKRFDYFQGPTERKNLKVSIGCLSVG